MVQHNNLYPSNIENRRKIKEKKLNQNAKVIWFTGLSGSGKTTLACSLEKELNNLNFFCQVLDGDRIRSNINKDLQFSEKDRTENIRRIAEVSKLFLNSGIIVICAFISPLKEMRLMAKEIIGKNDYLEIFVNTPIEICEQRDNKGLYKKARNGKIKNFTGISSPFEKPNDAFLEINNTNSNTEKIISDILLKILPKIQYK